MLLLSSVPPAFASSNWSKPRPSEYTVYNETIGNADSNSKCSVGLGVEISDYIPSTEIIDYDTLRLRIITSANTRKSIEYGCGLSLMREYEWYNVSTPTNINGDNDGEWRDMFTFLYYGVEYHKVWVCSNGFLCLNKTCTSPNPQSIPNTGEPNPVIAAFWRDLHPEEGGNITYGFVDYDNYFVVSWNGVPDDDDVPQTFQIVIENQPGGSLSHNKIYFQYKDITKNRYTVVGVENQIGNRGDYYNYNDLQNELILECSNSAAGLYRLSRLKIRLTKDDDYAKIELKETDVGGYNVFLKIMRIRTERFF